MDSALLNLGRALRQRAYSFTTPTPATHALANSRVEHGVAKSLTDVFGWSRPFVAGTLPSQIENLAREAGVIIDEDRHARSTVRFSTLGEGLFVHSAFPTHETDDVFFGPDTYRFARVLKGVAETALPKHARLLDMGCGSGAGGIYLAGLLRRRCDVDLVLGDINAKALRYSMVNARLNACDARVAQSDVLNGIEGDADVIIANPPYLLDNAKRLYRHGDGQFGEGLSVRIVRECMPRLRRRGTLVVYTGTAIVDGVDTFSEAVRPLLKNQDSVTYETIDVDVFGEELNEQPYRHVDRIAVVALTVRRDRQ
jgi:SAM-dependent methyltransferase